MKRKDWLDRHRQLGIFRNSEYRVILYEDDPFCATALADEASGRGYIGVEHDIVPFDWADVFQQAEVDSIGERVALTQAP